MQAMTNVDDSIVWHEPYLNAQRIDKNGPVGLFRFLLEEAAKRRGMNYDGVLEMAKKLPYGYIGSEGLFMCL